MHSTSGTDRRPSPVVLLTLVCCWCVHEKLDNSDRAGRTAWFEAYWVPSYLPDRRVIDRANGSCNPVARVSYCAAKHVQEGGTEEQGRLLATVSATNINETQATRHAVPEKVIFPLCCQKPRLVFLRFGLAPSSAYSLLCPAETKASENFAATLSGPRTRVYFGHRAVRHEMGLFGLTSPPAGENLASLTLGVLKRGNPQSASCTHVRAEEGKHCFWNILVTSWCCETGCYCIQPRISQSLTILLVCNSSPFRKLHCISSTRAVHYGAQHV